MAIYFFANDLYKYACFTSYYLVNMFAMKEDVHLSWTALKNKRMSVFKSNIPLCGLRIDHTLEQEIRHLCR